VGNQVSFFIFLYVKPTLPKKENRKARYNKVDTYNELFHDFLVIQEGLLRDGDNKLMIYRENEKERYLDFILGALSTLTRMINDKEVADRWYYIKELEGKVLERATILVGDVGPQYLESYLEVNGQSYRDTIKRGEVAMSIFLKSISGKTTQSEFDASTLELYDVIHDGLD